MTAFPHPGIRTRLALLVLPALLLRALIPVGFMPVAGPGGVSIGLCPGDGAMAQIMTHAGHAGHAAPAGHHPGGSPDPSAAHHAPCVFSSGASVGFVPILSASPCALAGLVSRSRSPGARGFVPAILRTQSPRAPPLSA